jgi:peptidoglycan-N-acetylglucosamine deacetylase
LLEEARCTEELLGSILGRPPSLFRPPKGELSAAKLWGLWRNKLTVVLWNVDPQDYACSSPREVEAWFGSHPLRTGDLVLLHDNQPHAAEALPELIASGRGHGLRFVTVGEWLR